MSDRTTRLPARPSLEQLRKQAKELLRNYHAADMDAVERFCAIIPRLADPGASENATLADAQFVLAREYEFESWASLKQHIEALPHPKLEPYERVAADMVLICRTGDADASQRITDLLGRTYPYPDRRAQLQRHLLVVRGPESRIDNITLDDARLIIARRFGFKSWAELAQSVTRPPADRRPTRLGMSSTPPFYKIDWKENSIELRPPVSDKDWDTIFGVINEHQITGLNAGGQMIDAAMNALAGMSALKGLAVSCINVDDASLSALPRFPSLRGLMPMDVPDHGFRHVGRCEQLENLWCMYCRDTGDAATEHIAGLSRLKTYYAGATQITDRSPEILGRMSSLESVEFYECAGITNAGIGVTGGHASAARDHGRRIA